MQRFEFKVVPAPKRGEKLRGVKSTEDRFALTLTQVMNGLGADGWDYVRADTLPCDERSGLTGTKTTYQHMLVFRRPLAEAAATAPAFNSLRAVTEAEGPSHKLGAANVPPGPAPALGPAKADIAAE
ncbi:MAG: DUF4177 domain-containing protein [Pseudotabrizicola sp.]|uniref:DUF4177 domain-containing protein n=1 Tax=Pseudotabrizicola sp. TaxID=2939647 RepID=UPI00271FCBBF|nr:DUF4177 domain-containing protein [Pseudotabrizicola sp.]MDO8881368.1 DUF4177 domain-containing protein [Pseudotabrizicola sp.]MDP2080863.1 DUF4177 domain-containing protein [Pseudotabrizicola sp.]MDZ7572735.1 DUF4177 domain-containing protein [Pseudotabrizicola sp.]